MEDSDNYTVDPTIDPANAGVTVGRPVELNVNLEYIAHEIYKDQLAQAGTLYATELSGKA